MQRLRQEIIAPTLSSLAYNAPDPADVEIDGYTNPYGRKVEPPTPKRAENNSAIPYYGGRRRKAITSQVVGEDGGPAWVASHGYGNGRDDEDDADIGESLTRALYPDQPPALEVEPDAYIQTNPPHVARAEFPVQWFVTPTKAEEWAAWALADPETRASANKAWRKDYAASHARGLDLFVWLRERHYAREIGGNQQRFTGAGLWLLGEVAAGRWREFDPTPTPEPLIQ